jgi:hypothetical protein
MRLHATIDSLLTLQQPSCNNALIAVLAWAQFISTGAIECVEGGGHYRPNKHAELARDIFRALERLLADPASAREPKLLARKTHTKCALPLCMGLHTLLVG